MMATWYVNSNASTVWASSTAYTTGQRVSHETYPNRIYECTTGGTSGGSAPTFNQTVGGTTTDNTVTWTTRAFSSSWSNAAPSLFSVSGAMSAAGDVVLVEYRHAYAPTTSQTTAFPGDTVVLSVDKDNSDARRAGASELSTTSGVSPRYNCAAAAVFYGLSLGSNASSGYGGAIVFNNYTGVTGADYHGSLWMEDCILRCTGTSGIQVTPGYSFGRGTYVNCQFINGTLTYKQNLMSSTAGGCEQRFFGCVFSHPSDEDTDWTLFGVTATGIMVLVEDSDLSRFGSVFIANRAAVGVLRRCKINSALVAVDDAAKTENIASSVQCYDCDTVDDIGQTLSNLKRHHSGFGTVTYEDDTVYRSGLDGENYWSLKMTPNSSWSDKYRPLELLAPLAIWHPADGSKTLKVFLASDDSGLLDDEVWIHVTHVSANATTPAMGTFITTRGTGVAAGTSTYLKTGTIGQWTGSGPSTAYEFQITAIDPEEPGYIYVRVFYGYTGSYSVWVDPAITLTT